MNLTTGSRVPFSKHLELIDWLKGIAIVMVILVHYAQSFTLTPFLQNFFRFFQMGVQVFLLISAFTICESYASKKPSYLQFLKHRFSVLAKGWYLAILISILINIIHHMIFSEYLLHRGTPAEIILNLLFLNGLVRGYTNNYIVRGGWFVGTISIFYFFFPLIYKIYMIDSAKWKKYRYILFPTLSFIFSISILNIANMLSTEFKCNNNSFVYFNIICQWPCLSLGFSLYDIISQNKGKTIHFTLLKFLTISLLAVCLFYSNIPQIFTAVPFVSALAVFYLFLYMYNNYPSKHYNTVFIKYGTVNFGIYLTHPFIAYELTRLCKSLILSLIPNISQTVIFILLCPFTLAISYFVGKYFLKTSNAIWNSIFRIR